MYVRKMLPHFFMDIEMVVLHLLVCFPDFYLREAFVCGTAVTLLRGRKHDSKKKEKLFVHRRGSLVAPWSNVETNMVGMSLTRHCTSLHSIFPHKNERNESRARNCANALVTHTHL